MTTLPSNAIFLASDDNPDVGLEIFTSANEDGERTVLHVVVPGPETNAFWFDRHEALTVVRGIMDAAGLDLEDIEGGTHYSWDPRGTDPLALAGEAYANRHAAQEEELQSQAMRMAVVDWLDGMHPVPRPVPLDAPGALWTLPEDVDVWESTDLRPFLRELAQLHVRLVNAMESNPEAFEPQPDPRPDHLVLLAKGERDAAAALNEHKFLNSLVRKGTPPTIIYTEEPAWFTDGMRCNGLWFTTSAMDMPGFFPHMFNLGDGLREAGETSRPLQVNV